MQSAPVTRLQVPRFAKCAKVSELRPQLNAQPLFRRADPEGGFISVSSRAQDVEQECETNMSMLASASSYYSSPSYLPNM